jgi:hypothetical protein
MINIIIGIINVYVKRVIKDITKKYVKGVAL